jgi:hypothetical protein
MATTDTRRGVEVRRRQPRAIRIVAALTVCCSGLLAVLAPGNAEPGVIAVLVGAVGLVVGELVTVTLPIARGRTWRFAGFEVALAASLLYLPGVGLWAAALGAALVVGAIRRHQGWAGRTLEYAAASCVGAAGLASVLFALLNTGVIGRPEAAGLAVVAAAALRHCLAAVAVGLTSRRPLLALVRRKLPTSCLQAAGNAAIGLLAAELASREPAGLVGLLLPALLLVSSYEQQVRRSAQAGLYAELARAQERAGARSVDASAAIVLTVAARMLGGADIEMLLHGSDGLVRYRGDESGLQERSRVTPAALDAPWMLRLLASGGVRLTREAGRPECSVCIGAAKSPFAFLLARRHEGAPAFSRREAALVRALAGQVEPWLSGALDGDASAASSASSDRADDGKGLAELREAARRVLASAEAQQFDPDGLMGELHSLERAAAQHLGAGVDADLAREAGGAAGEPAAVPARRRSADWTTTGRLP